MSTLTAPLATSLVDQVKAHLANAGHDAAVRHRKTHALMRGGFLARTPEASVVLVYHQDFPPSTPEERVRMVSAYAEALTGHGITFTRARSPQGTPYLIVRRLV